MGMISRFEGDRGAVLLVEQLQRQKLVAGEPGLAEALQAVGTLQEVAKDATLIEQGGTDTDVFFIIGGAFEVCVNKKVVAHRAAGDEVGEMTAISPTQIRSATVVATQPSLVLKVSEEAFADVANGFPGLWRRLGQELSRRLEQRNALVRTPNDKVRVFVISSAEALPVARAVRQAFSHDPFLTVVWGDGVFKVSNYTLQSLEDELEQADFAVAIAHPDDTTTTRDSTYSTPRDNVVFELGFFMGRLGRSRAILMEPREKDKKVKLPTDLAGVTTIGYQYKAENDIGSYMGPACDELRDHINKLGPNI